MSEIETEEEKRENRKRKRDGEEKMLSGVTVVKLTLKAHKMTTPKRKLFLTSVKKNEDIEKFVTYVTWVLKGQIEFCGYLLILGLYLTSLVCCPVTGV